MENLYTGKNEKEQLIQKVKERLNWFTFLASEEEFDEKEVEALVDLLNVLEPMEIPDGQGVGRTFEQFEQYLDEKQADAEMLALLYGHKEDSTKEDIVREDGINETAVNEAVVNEAVVNEAAANGVVISKVVINKASIDGADANNAVFNEVTFNEAAINETVVNGTDGNEIAINKAVATETAVTEVAANELSVNGTASEEGSSGSFSGKVIKGRHFGKIAFWPKMNIFTDKAGKYPLPVTAAAIFIALFLTGGTVSAIKAGEGGGFFNWIYKGVTGQKVVMVPQEEELTMEQEAFQYYGESEVPEKYQEYVAGIEDMETLRDYELEVIEIGGSDKCTKILYKVINDNEKLEAILGCLLYENQLQIKQEVFYDYEYLREEELGGIYIYIYLRKDTLSQEDYVICFFAENIEYFVQGKQNIEVTKQIAVEYAKMHLE